MLVTRRDFEPVFVRFEMAFASSQAFAMLFGRLSGMYVCMDFYGAYNYSGLVRQVSGFIMVNVSA